MELMDALRLIMPTDYAHAEFVAAQIEVVVAQVEALSIELMRVDPRVVEVTGIAYILLEMTKEFPDVLPSVKRIVQFVEGLAL